MLCVWQVMIVFYQIATKVDSVYEVELPADVKQMLNSLSITFSFGISYAATPLECMGLNGYTYKLIAYMLMPPIVVGVVLIVVCLKACLAKRQKSSRARHS